MARSIRRRPAKPRSRASRWTRAKWSRLLEVEPGSDFNLSSAEIAVFQDLAQQHKAGDPAAADAVNAAWRQVLAGRMQAYLARGLDGIARLRSGRGDTSSAADDLSAAAEGSKLVQQAVPELYQAFLAYPNQARGRRASRSSSGPSRWPTTGRSTS